MPNSTVTSAIAPKFDLHCHILPEWDDGPDTLDDSLRMAERAVESGVEIVVATPHVGRKFKGRKRSSADIAAGVESLQREIDSRNIPLQVKPGAEIFMGAVDLLGEKFSPEWSYAGGCKYVLVESPYPSWPDFGDNYVYELSLKRITCVIAHPERYVDVQKNPAKLERLVGQGALVQITADSLTDRAPKPHRACALKLLDLGLVHIVASDAHSTNHTWPGEVAAQVVDRVGVGLARQIFEKNPLAVIEGRMAPHPIPPETQSQGWAASLIGKFFRN